MPDPAPAPPPAATARGARGVRAHFHHAWPAYLVLACALFLTGALFEGSRRMVQAEDEDRFQRTVRDVRAAVDRRVAAHLQMLRGAAALFAASHGVEREAFHAYLAAVDVRARYPGVLHVGYAARVPAAARAAHEAAMRRQGFPGYAISPAGARAEYLPVIFLEPFEGMAPRAVGFDVGSEGARRAALEAARDAGAPRITEKLILLADVVDGTPQPGFMVFVPVYRNGRAAGTVEERRAALRGFVYGSFRAADFVRGVVGGRGAPSVEVDLFDGPEVRADRLLAGPDGAGHFARPPAGWQLTRTESLDVAGRTWTMYFATLPAFHESGRRHVPLGVMLGGLTVSALAFAGALGLARARAVAERASAGLRESERRLREDIGERQQAEVALREAEARHRAILESSLDAVVAMDREGRITEFNPAAERMFGHAREAAVGQRLADLLIPPALRDRQREGLRRHLATGEAVVIGSRVEMPALRGDGTEFPVELTVSRVELAGGPAFTAFVRDVSDRKRADAARQQLEAQFRQAQKMEAVGRLAGGVAHDFNNLLTVITGRAHLLLSRLKPEDPMHRDAELIQKTAQRAVALTTRLLAFSRKQVLQPRVLDLSAVVTGVTPMIQRLLGVDVELAFVPAAEPARVKADPGQVEQVLMNLVINARDAMPRGGRVTIATGGAVLDEAAAARGTVRPGAYVTLSVADTGVGIDAETRSHLFEPFFTTKEPGKGTGLGLSTVWGIVEQSGGAIEVESEPGRGATFTIYLPRVEEAVAGPGPAAAAARSRSTARTILLVDDEPEVRELAGEILQRVGYTVLEASSGPEALAVAERQPGGLHLLVTDMVMPGMSGRELAERLRARQPGLRVLYISGYVQDPAARAALSGEHSGFLAKPFTPETLTGKVRELLATLGDDGA